MLTETPSPFSAADAAYTAILGRLAQLEHTVEAQQALLADPWRGQLFTLDEAAALCSVHYQTLRGWTQFPEEHHLHLPSIRIGQQIRIFGEELRAWLERNRASALRTAA